MGVRPSLLQETPIQTNATKRETFSPEEAQRHYSRIETTGLKSCILYCESEGVCVCADLGILGLRGWWVRRKSLGFAARHTWFQCSPHHLLLSVLGPIAYSLICYLGLKVPA